jgi:uncharacterized integral membrane protein
MKVIYTVIVAIFVMFIITFSLENKEAVRLSYLGWEFFRPIPIYMLIFISFLAGVIFTGFMGVVERFRLHRTIKHLNKTIRDLQREMKLNENPPYIEDQEEADRPSGEECL